MQYRNRSEAGTKLADLLTAYKGQDCVVYALLRGGVPVGFEVARALSAPLDLVLVRKIGAPFQPELALGAVAEGDPPEIVLNEDVAAILQPSADMVDAAAAKEMREMDRRRRLYRSGRTPISAAGRIAILVDDGLATGATARAALRAIRRQAPRRLVLAVPVAPISTVDDLKAEADEVICPHALERFHPVGVHYDDFEQVADEDVIALLAQARKWPAFRSD